MSRRLETHFERQGQAKWLNVDIVVTPCNASDSEAARQRRDDDQRLAALLLEGGIAAHELFVLPDAPDDEDQLVSDDGDYTEALGRPLRRWPGFASQAFRAKTRRGLFYTAFAAEHGIETVRQICVAAPVCSLPLNALRRAHEVDSARLRERLRYGIARYAPNLAVDLIAAEIVRDGTGAVYLHFHLVIRGGSAEELEALRRYWVGEGPGRLPSGWAWWDAEGDDERLERHPAALVQYAAAGLAEALDDEWTPAELAELFRQTRGLAMVRAVGPFRRWLGKLDVAGETVQRGKYGVAEIVPKTPPRNGARRLKEKLFSSAGFIFLRRVEHDFGDGVRRSAWLVRGRPGVTAADIKATYMAYTAIPETPAKPPTSHPMKPADPPSRRPRPTPSTDDEIPW